MTRAFAGAGPLLVALACTPTVPDGAFFCTDGRCPEGFVCAADDVCYATGQAPGTTCEEHGECAGGLCARGPSGARPPDEEEEGEGYCSRTCEADDDCRDLGGDAGGRCVEDECLRTCTVGPDPGCPGETDCVLLPEDGPRNNRGVCLAVSNRRLLDTARCTAAPEMGSMPCDLPGFCARPTAPASAVDEGICTVRCLGGAECGGAMDDRTCVLDLFGDGGGGSCLRRCTVDSDCTGGGGQETGLVCGAVEVGDPTYCIPPSWIGAGPFPGRAPL